MAATSQHGIKYKTLCKSSLGDQVAHCVDDASFQVLEHIGIK